jgi:hypothetical protein
MTVTIRLPQNKRDAAFILQFLKKMNISIDRHDAVTEELSEELKQLLNDRLDDLEENPNDEMSMSEFEKIYLQTN